MFKSFKALFFSDKRGVSFILSILATLILVFPYNVLGFTSLAAFVLTVLVPLVAFAVYREKLQAAKYLRAYDFMNVLITSWVPIFVSLLMIFI